MNLTELLEERSAGPPVTVGHGQRLAAVRGRVLARRRQRLAAAGAAGIVLSVLVGIGWVGLSGADRRVEPADTIDGFPVYHQGTRVLAAESGPLTEPLTLTFTPPDADLTLHWRCDPGTAEALSFSELEFRLGDEVLVNATGTVPCGDPEPVAGPERWFEVGVEPGVPSTVTAVIIGGPVDESGQPVAPPAGAEWGIAVAEAVPFEEYVPPPPPESLPRLPDPDDSCDYPVRVRSDPSEPNRPVTATLTPEPPPEEGLDPLDNRADLEAYEVSLYSQTPGQLVVRVDGTPAGELTAWAYGGMATLRVDLAALRRAGLDLPPGTPVTMSFEPAHMAGEWTALMAPAAAGMCW